MPPQQPGSSSNDPPEPNNPNHNNLDINGVSRANGGKHQDISTSAGHLGKKTDIEVHGVNSPISPIVAEGVGDDDNDVPSSHQPLNLSSPKDTVATASETTSEPPTFKSPPELSSSPSASSATAAPKVFGAAPPPPTQPLSQAGGAPVVGGFSTLPGAPGPVTPATSPPQLKTKRRLLKRAILPIIIVLVVGGASAAAYFGYYVPNEPKNVLQTALINMISGTKLNSAHFSGNATITDSSSKQTYTASITGAADRSGKFQATASVDAVVTTISVQVVTADGKNFYIKIGGLDGLTQILNSVGASSGITGLVPLINSINNQWYEVDQSLVSQLEKSMNITPSTALTQADINTISNLYKKDDFLSVQKTYANQVVAGTNSDHYRAVIGKTKLQAFVSGLKNAHISNLGVGQDVFNTLNTDIGRANTANYPFDVWVSKSDKLIDQVSLSSTSDGDPYSVKFMLSNINQPVSVSVPASSKSILQLIGQITQDYDLSAGGTNSGASGTANPLDLLDPGGPAQVTQNL